MKKNGQFNRIIWYIKEERLSRGISVHSLGVMPRNTSALTFDDFLNDELMLTKEGYGLWFKLSSSEIKKEINTIIQKIKEERGELP